MPSFVAQRHRCLWCDAGAVSSPISSWAPTGRRHPTGPSDSLRAPVSRGAAQSPSSPSFPASHCPLTRCCPAFPRTSGQTLRRTRRSAGLPRTVATHGPLTCFEWRGGGYARRCEPAPRSSNSCAAWTRSARMRWSLERRPDARFDGRSSAAPRRVPSIEVRCLCSLCRDARTGLAGHRRERPLLGDTALAGVRPFERRPAGRGTAGTVGCCSGCAPSCARGTRCAGERGAVGPEVT